MIPVVVGIGEVLWDIYADGARLGGAPANFACHAAAQGVESWIVSAVGVDELGERAAEDLRALGVRADIVRDRGHPTGRVNVAVDAAGRPTFEIAPDAAWDHIPWTANLESLANRADAVCFGTLAQRSPVSRETISRFLRVARPSALRMFDVNLRQSYYDPATIERSLELASGLKLNEDELPTVASACGIRAANTTATLRALAQRFELRIVAVTRGAEGATLVAGDAESVEPAPPVTVVDTVGAGDAFTATLVCGVLAGASLAEINRHANAVAAYVCSQAGAMPVRHGGASALSI